MGSHQSVSAELETVNTGNSPNAPDSMTEGSGWPAFGKRMG